MPGLGLSAHNLGPQARASLERRESMPKQFEVESIEDTDEKIMRGVGYSEETIDEVKRQRETIIPAPRPLEYRDIIYIAIMPDDSASIAGWNAAKRDNTKDVIAGHNAILDALKGSQEARKILFKTQYLNSDTLLNNWEVLDKAIPMTSANFKPDGGTPLYDKTLSLLASVILERARAIKRGSVQARWGILIITDADDTASVSKASKVKLILDDMRKTGELLDNCQPDNMHAGSIALMGIEDGTTDFEAVAHSMGINWILHANRLDPSDIRRKFNTFSRRFLTALR